MLRPARRLRAMAEAFGPTNLHIATEGLLGTAARRWALRRGSAFTTSFLRAFLNTSARASGFRWGRSMRSCGGSTVPREA